MINGNKAVWKHVLYYLVLCEHLVSCTWFLFLFLFIYLCEILDSSCDTKVIKYTIAN